MRVEDVEEFIENLGVRHVAGAQEDRDIVAEPSQKPTSSSVVAGSQNPGERTSSSMP
jgi:hypothetical protein